MPAPCAHVMRHCRGSSPITRSGGRCMWSRALSGGAHKGEIYAVIEQPYSLVAPALARPEGWCQMLTLQVNIKRCSADQSGQAVAAFITRKTRDAIESAHRVAFRYEPTTKSGDYLSVALSAPSGPMGTHDYQTVLEAAPLHPISRSTRRRSRSNRRLRSSAVRPRVRPLLTRPALTWSRSAGTRTAQDHASHLRLEWKPVREHAVSCESRSSWHPCVSPGHVPGSIDSSPESRIRRPSLWPTCGLKLAARGPSHVRLAAGGRAVAVTRPSNKI
jgi:hypothetical protein